jgi:hypothetical protein
MTDDEILALMIENEILKKAIAEIAEFDASAKNGYLDEWEEADAFSECQEIARKALAQANIACSGQERADSTPALLPSNDKQPEKPIKFFSSSR